MTSFLVIQTASIGDVILATPVLEKLHNRFPDAKIDVLVKAGMEQLFDSHPFINQILVWEKSRNKYAGLFNLLKTIRVMHYDYIINLQRFASTGFLTAFGGAKSTAGFDKNPFSFLFSTKVKHLIGHGETIHEIERNLSLITHITDNQVCKPKLYPSKSDFDFVYPYKKSNYICIAPASLWFTKQLTENQWTEFVKSIPKGIKIYLLGSKDDTELCDRIIQKSFNQECKNLAGAFTLMQSAALIKDAKMNFVNDSSPLHLASAMNAPITAIFCSTVLSFGFGPLSDNSFVVQTTQNLPCRPCGLHGYKQCPEGHFKCAITIETQQILNRLIL